MPIEGVAELTQSHQVMEYKSIRIGEQGEKSPRKTRPRVKDKTKEGLEIDEILMKEIAAKLGIEAKDWHEVDAIPVMAMTDKIRGGIIHIERAFYTGGNNRRCASVAGVETATQFIDVEAYAKNKSIKVLGQSREVQCSPTACPMWAKPGEKSDCSFRAIISVMLVDRPVFPSTVPLRTKSKNSIKILHASLEAISAVTGGILMGIPLWLKQYYIDKKDGDGKTRRIPVMTFEFKGTTRELRQHAIREAAHRSTLKAAVNGEPIVAHGFSVGDEDVTESEEVIEEPKEDHGIGDQIALLMKKLGYTGAMLRTLEDKHEGSLESVLSELKDLAGEKQPQKQEEWSSGDVGEDDWDEMEF